VKRLVAVGLAALAMALVVGLLWPLRGCGTRVTYVGVTVPDVGLLAGPTSTPPSPPQIFAAGAAAAASPQPVKQLSTAHLRPDDSEETGAEGVDGFSLLVISGEGEPGGIILSNVEILLGKGIYPQTNNKSVHVLLGDGAGHTRSLVTCACNVFGDPATQGGIRTFCPKWFTDVDGALHPAVDGVFGFATHIHCEELGDAHAVDVDDEKVFGSLDLWERLVVNSASVGIGSIVPVSVRRRVLQNVRGGAQRAWQAVYMKWSCYPTLDGTPVPGTPGPCDSGVWAGPIAQARNATGLATDPADFAIGDLVAVDQGNPASETSIRQMVLLFPLKDRHAVLTIAGNDGRPRTARPWLVLIRDAIVVGKRPPDWTFTGRERVESWRLDPHWPANCRTAAIGWRLSNAGGRAVALAECVRTEGRREICERRVFPEPGAPED